MARSIGRAVQRPHPATYLQRSSTAKVDTRVRALSPLGCLGYMDIAQNSTHIEHPPSVVHVLAEVLREYRVERRAIVDSPTGVAIASNGNSSRWPLHLGDLCGLSQYIEPG